MKTARLVTPTEIVSIAQARAFELINDLEKRNEIAHTLFHDSTFRVIETPQGFRVETWWDRTSRNWITQRLNRDGSEIWDDGHGRFVGADYSGHRLDAAVAHFWAVCKALHLVK